MRASFLVLCVAACTGGSGDLPGSSSGGSTSSTSSSGDVATPIDCGGTQCTKYCFKHTCGGGVDAGATAPCTPPSPTCGDLDPKCGDGGALEPTCPGGSDHYTCPTPGTTSRTVSCFVE